MTKYIGIAVASLVMAVSCLAQQSPKPVTFPKIASIEGPCAQIVGRLCYNPYQGEDKADSYKGWFGVYSFDDKDHKVAFVERFDCHHPNGRRKWGSANPSNPDSTYPVYNSSKVKDLFESCYGVAE